MENGVSSLLVFGYLIGPTQAFQVAERIKDSGCELLPVDEQRSAYACFSRDSRIGVMLGEIFELDRSRIDDASAQETWSRQLAELLQDDDENRPAASWLLLPLSL